MLRGGTAGHFVDPFAGVPLIQALTVVARAVDNTFIGERILAMRNGVERGDSLMRTAGATTMFTPLVLQMMAVGEETGSVDDMMDEVADFYEREVDYDLKNLIDLMRYLLPLPVPPPSRPPMLALAPPPPRVTNPRTSSPGTGVQHRASFAQTSLTPLTVTPALPAERRPV